MPESPPPVPEAKAGHLYGGQALIEGVMMRGKNIWAAAVRRPDDSIYVESHEIDSVARRHPFLAKPGIRGVIAFGQAMALGYRAMMLSLRKSQPDGEEMGEGSTWFAMGLAIVLFLLVFIVFPAWLFHWIGDVTGMSDELTTFLEGIFRLMLLVAYVGGIGRMKDIRRVYQYHGAEHKTIAAFEHDAPLVPEEVDKFSTLHVRCGTNFLFIIFFLAFLIFLVIGLLDLHVTWFLLSRILVFPIIASIAYEALRMGARFKDSTLVRAMMKPGLWLQMITTKPPDHAQIEVAIASFEEVLRAERERTLQEEGEFTPAKLEADAAGVGIRPD